MKKVGDTTFFFPPSQKRYSRPKKARTIEEIESGLDEFSEKLKKRMETHPVDFDDETAAYEWSKKFYASLNKS